MYTKNMLKSVVLAFFVFFLYTVPGLASTSIPFTITLSKAVNVTGTPRIALDVGGITPSRYATYTSGSGTSTLIFTYTMVAGDVDLDGITLTASIDLNGGTIKDLAGNDLTPLTFTAPNTTNVKVNYPSLGMDFVYDADGRYTLNGTVYNDLTSFLSAASGSFARASVGTYFDSAGVLQTATSGVPRFDYAPVTHVAKGLLMEESRINIPFPTSMTSNFYSGGPGGVTVTFNQSTGPDNTTSMAKLQKNATTSGYFSYNLALSGSVKTVTYSIFAKAGSANYLSMRLQGTYPSRADATFNLTNGTYTTSKTNFTSVSASTTNIGNGIYRCSITTTSDNTGISYGYISAVNTSTDPIDATTNPPNNIYVYGPQIEQGAFPTSYIPTTTAAVTRAADTLSMPTGTWFNAATGTLFSEFSIPVLGGSVWPGSVSIDDGTLNNAIHLIVRDAVSDEKASEIYNGNVNQFSSIGAVYTADTISRQALYYATNAALLSNDGTLLTLDTSINVPTVNTLRLGSGRASNGYKLNGYVRKFKYYPLRTADTQLQLLTQ